MKKKRKKKITIAKTTVLEHDNKIDIRNKRFRTNKPNQHKQETKTNKTQDFKPTDY